jgi:O-antigen ligase
MRIAFAALVGFLFFVYFEPAVLFPFVVPLRLAFVLAIAALVAAFVSGARFASHGTTWALVWFAVWAGLSTFAAVNVDRGLLQMPYVLKAVALYLVVTMVVRSPARLMRFTYINLTLAAIVATTTILTTRAGIAPLSGRRDLWRMVNYFGGLGDDPNEFGAFMLAVLPLPFVFLQHERSTARKVAFGLLTLAFLLCILRTRSRGAFLGLLAAMPLLMWESRRNLAAVAFAALIIVYAYTHTQQSYWERIGTAFSDTAIEEDGSASGRLQQQAYAAELISRRPVLGVGPGNWVPAKIRLLGLDRRHNQTLLHPHNTYLGIASEMGVPGLAAFLLAIGLAFRSLARARRTFATQGDRQPLASLAAGLMTGLVGFCVAVFFLSEPFNLILYMWIAMSVVLGELAAQTPGIVPRSTGVLHPVAAYDRR